MGNSNIQVAALVAAQLVSSSSVSYRAEAAFRDYFERWGNHALRWIEEKEREAADVPF